MCKTATLKVTSILLKTTKIANTKNTKRVELSKFIFQLRFFYVYPDSQFSDGEGNQSTRKTQKTKQSSVSAQTIFLTKES